jgi:hypothetical protein
VFDPPKSRVVLRDAELSQKWRARVTHRFTFVWPGQSGRHCVKRSLLYF